LAYAVTDGPHNMAADEALLESAIGGVASLRFYGWSPATVSLGYFQPAALRDQDPLLADLPYVRRQSGGATLVHHHEVTYVLALPAGRLWQTGESWLCRMHDIIGKSLGRLGIRAQLHSCSTSEPFRGVLCFQHFTPGDLIIEQAKVVGSAQRKQRGALMQHGGILLARSPHAPVLPGIAELSGRSVAAAEVIEAVQMEFTLQTSWALYAGDWTETERRRKEELAATKYMTESWNRKR
jgi:lipoate-protein ligase A